MGTNHQRDSKSELKKIGRLDDGPYSCLTTTSGSKSSAKTLIEYDVDESLDIKEEIIQDQQDSKSELQKSTGRQDGWLSSGTTTTSGSNSSTKTLIKYYIDATLDIKEEITQVSEKIIVQEQNKTYELKSCSVHIKEKDILNADRVRHKTSSKKLVVAHKVKKQFICDYCEHKSNRKCDLLNHITSRHLPASNFRHKCDKCSRDYKWLKHLNQHKHEDHAAVKIQFICDYCEHKSSRKRNLLRHITLGHLLASKFRHKCDKCPRSYKWPQGLTQHKRLVHSDATTKFICDYCENKWNSKMHLARHITSRHLQASNSRHECDICERSYNWPQSLTRHIRVYHATVQ